MPFRPHCKTDTASVETPIEGSVISSNLVNGARRRGADAGTPIMLPAENRFW
jgi:hypothetical protein